MPNRKPQPSHDPLETPDGRYLVVHGKIWRRSNPALSAAERERLVARLMDARRAVKKALRSGDELAERRARNAVDEAKHALGERGEPWWSDGAPDYNRRPVADTPYAEWFEDSVQRAP